MKRKILCAYRTENGHPNSGYEGYIHGLRKLGHEVYWIDSGMLNLAPKSGYDLLIQFDCCDIFGPPKDLQYPNVYWMYDSWQNPTNLRQLDYEPDGIFNRSDYYIARAKLANWTFNMSRIGIKNLAKHGVQSHYLPIGADERQFVASEEHYAKLWSIASACNNWHMGHQNDRRGELTGILQQKYPNTFITSGVLYYEIMRLYARSKIVWNYSPCGFDVLNFRVWEALGSGTPFLTNEIIKSQLNALGFNDLVTYYRDDGHNLTENVDWILSNYIHCFNMAQRALTEVKAYHTMRHRMEEMLEVIELK